MQDTHYIQRKLTVENWPTCESEALQDERHPVVMAETGARKAELLENFARIFSVTRQRTSTSRSQWKTQCGETLVVDGFDEIAKLDQSASDSLIGKIANVGPKRGIIAG